MNILNHYNKDLNNFITDSAFENLKKKKTNNKKINKIELTATTGCVAANKGDKRTDNSEAFDCVKGK